MVSQKDSYMSVVGPYCMLDGDVRSLSGIRGLCQHTETIKILFIKTFTASKYN